MCDTKTCTLQQFQQMADNMWNTILSEKDPNKIIEIKSKEMHKLMSYTIISEFNSTGIYLIDNFCLSKYDKDANRSVYTGSFSGPDSFLNISRKYGFKEMYDWSHYPGRIVVINKESKCIATYCENDISFVLCSADDSFEQELKEAAEFYKLNN